MKKILLLCACVMVLALQMVGIAETTALAGEGGTVTVQGSATISLEPDWAVLQIGVITRGATAAEALQQNNQQISAVIAALMQQGVAEPDMQTSNLYINPEYSYESVDASSAHTLPAGYAVNNTLEVLVRDIDTLSAVFDAGMQAGANQMYGLTFLSSKKQEGYEKAMQDALADARKKADIIAQTTGLTLGSIVSVTEQGSGYGGMMPYAKGAMAENMATPMMEGTIAVEAALTVTYTLQ